MEDLANWMLARPRPRPRLRNLAELNLGHYAEHVVLGFKVVEERSLAHVGGFGNVFHRDVREAALGKSSEHSGRGADGFQWRGARDARPPVRQEEARESMIRSHLRSEMRDFRPYMSDGQFRPLVIYSH